MTDKPETQSDILREAVKSAGGQDEVAESLGVSQQAISAWVNRGYVPVHRARQFAAVVGLTPSEVVSDTLREVFKSA